MTSQTHDHDSAAHGSHAERTSRMLERVLAGDTTGLTEGQLRFAHDVLADTVARSPDLASDQLSATLDSLLDQIKTPTDADSDADGTEL